MSSVIRFDTRPGDNRTYELDLANVDEWVAGDTVASAAVTWGASGAPGTVGSITGSASLVLVPLTGFAVNTKYYGRFLVTSSSGAVFEVEAEWDVTRPTSFA